MTDSQKPTAFVIMPFDEGFDEIYGLFIAGALSDAGYEVLRADDIRNQQNILKDVLAGLTDSTVVVADLTGSNPNVYYELGLAHALGKRVILLAQHVDELPFDLRSYRVIPYSTHFADISKARAQLSSVAKDALDGRIAFGSPVTDFLITTPGTQTRLAPKAEPLTALPPGEPGTLDHLVDLEEGFAHLARVIEATNSDMTSVSDATTEIGARLNGLAQSGSPARTRRVVVIELATRLDSFANSLAAHNEDYAATLATTRTSLESVIRAHRPTTEEERAQLTALVSQLDTAEEGTRSQRVALAKLIEIIRSTPRVERMFNRAADAAVRHLEGYAQNVDQTSSMIVRARELASSRLSESAG